MEEKTVFDFTKSVNLSNEEFDWYCYFNSKKRKSYKVGQEINSKITISMVNDDDEHYDCIYFYKDKTEVYEMIKNKQSLNLEGCYIKNFNITEIDNYKDYKLLNFYAVCSFWDGDVRFTGAKFEDGDVRFDLTSFGDSDVNFYEAKFGDGVVNFSNTNFGNGYVYFVNITFGDGIVNFQKAIFSNVDVDSHTRFRNIYAYFSDTSFGNGDVVFNNTTFSNGNISFDNTTFGNGVVDFSASTFEDGVVRFCTANFGNGDVNFSDTSFGNSYVQFSDTKIGDGVVNFSNTSFNNGYLVFTNITFGNGDVCFTGAKFEVCYVDLKKVTFRFGNSSFFKPSGVKFNKITFKSHVDLQFEKINELVIEDCIIEKTLKISGKPEKLSFLNTINLGQIFINWTANNVYKAINEGENLISNYGLHKTILKLKSLEKASQFRMLKENFHNIGDYEAEDAAYRAYMNCKIKGSKWYRKPIKFFSLVGGYGTQPFSIIITMIVSWFGFAFAYYYLLSNSFINNLVKSFWDALYYSGITFLTIGYGDISPSLTGTALRFVSVAEGFVGLFLMSYLTVAVVRKILR